MLSGLVAARHSCRLVSTGNVLLADFVSVYTAIDNITNTKFDGSVAMCIAVVETRKWEEETVALFASKTNSGNISLDCVNVSTDAVAGVVLLTKKIILLTEFYGNLTVRG
jgi:hypothetical protein